MANTSPLAIAAPAFHRPSETFIHAHVRTIAPWNTVLICADWRGTEQYGNPVLSHFKSWQYPESAAGKIVNAIQNGWRVFVEPGLSKSDRRRAQGFLAAHKTKAVLAEYGVTGCLLMRTCEEADVPLYVHFHGSDASMMLRDWRWLRHYRVLFRKAVGIIVPSRFLAGNLLEVGCPEAKLHVVPCGVDPQRFKPAQRIPHRILAVGRLVAKKAPHLTIAAFGRIAKQYPGARLDMIGEGPLAGRCRDLIHSLKLENRVRMHGVQSAAGVAQFMAGASIFAQHSITTPSGEVEGLPVALLEAMASALPITSTRHSGIPEAVEDGVCGILVDEGDVDAMAAAMAGLLDDPDRAAEMGRAGRQRVLTQYTHEIARDRLRAIIGLPPLIETQSNATTAAL